MEDIMNRLFSDSKQRFSIRKFSVGIASVLISTAIFGFTAPDEVIRDFFEQKTSQTG